jgi:cytoskeletal protein CcmA (bactofilin family)
MTKSSHSPGDDKPDIVALPGIMKSIPPPRGNSSFVVSTWLTRSKPSSAEGLVIDGNLECALAHHQQQLIVSRNARVDANLHARTVVVFGQLTGDIVCEGKVFLAEGSLVQGNIRCACLNIEEGARFKGQVVLGIDAAEPNVEYS